MIAATDLHLDLWKPVLVLGVLQAGLYGLMPIALVLSYRVSRTIAFVHGGIAAGAAFIYWELTYDARLVPGRHPAWPPVLGLVTVLAAGALAGGVYGAVVTSPRMVGRSRMTLTVMSLSAMLLLYGASTMLNVAQFVYPPTPFGHGSFDFAGLRVTSTRLLTLCCTTALVAVLAGFLGLTRTGRHVRAIADDLEGAQWSGVDVAGIGTGIYAAAGAVAALSGVLISCTVGADPGALLQFLLRALAVAVIGGMVSLPLALVGAAAVSILETAITGGMFGTVSLGVQELCIDAALVAGAVLITRLRGVEFYLLTRQSL
jgi:branched-subunit amino acid ABC-type transport system permease component